MRSGLDIAPTWLDYPTPALRVLLLEETHLTYAHCGAPKMAALLKERYFWPSLERDCASFVRSCFSCQLCDSRVSAPRWSSMLPLPPGPRHTFALDLLTDLPQVGDGPKHLLVAVCVFSKYVLLHPLQNKTAAGVMEFLTRTLVP